MDTTHTGLYVPVSSSAVLIGATKTTLLDVCNVRPIMGPLNDDRHEILLQKDSNTKPVDYEIAKIILKRHLDFIDVKAETLSQANNKGISVENKIKVNRVEGSDKMFILNHTKSFLATHSKNKRKLNDDTEIINKRFKSNDIEIIDIANEDKLDSVNNRKAKKANNKKLAPNTGKEIQLIDLVNEENNSPCIQIAENLLNLSIKEVINVDDDVISISSLDLDKSNRSSQLVVDSAAKKLDVGVHNDSVEIISESDGVQLSDSVKIIKDSVKKSSQGSSRINFEAMEFVDLSNDIEDVNVRNTNVRGKKKNKKNANRRMKERNLAWAKKDWVKTELVKLGYKIHDGFGPKKSASNVQLKHPLPVIQSANLNGAISQNNDCPHSERILMESKINTPANNIISNKVMAVVESINNELNFRCAPIVHSIVENTTIQSTFAAAGGSTLLQNQSSEGVVFQQIVSTVGTTGKIPNNVSEPTILPDIIDLNADRVGKNVCVPGDDSNIRKEGLRPIIIDGCNVAFSHGRNCDFSFKGLAICINYFKSRGHKTIAIVPTFRRSCMDDTIAQRWETEGTLVFSPSRKLDGKLIVSHDDRFIIQCAAAMEGVIVSKDNFREFLGQNPLWDETIERRLLMFTWVEDLLMFPEDPLGRYGPSLDVFLRFPQANNCGRNLYRNCRRGQR